MRGSDKRSMAKADMPKRSSKVRAGLAPFPFLAGAAAAPLFETWATTPFEMELVGAAKAGSESSKNTVKTRLV